MSREDHAANVAAFNALLRELHGAQPDSDSLSSTIWRRTKWAVLIRFAWLLANIPDRRTSAVWSPSIWVEFCPWPVGLFRLAADRPDANSAELAVMWWTDMTPESWEIMLGHDEAGPWLAAATPPGRRYSLAWPGRKNTAT